MATNRQTFLILVLQIYIPYNNLLSVSADFGFARFLNDGVMAATLCGSPMYMVCLFYLFFFSLINKVINNEKYMMCVVSDLM